jgi:hypothetical protein
MISGPWACLFLNWVEMVLTPFPGSGKHGCCRENDGVCEVQDCPSSEVRIESVSSQFRDGGRRSMSLLGFGRIFFSHEVST